MLPRRSDRPDRETLSSITSNRNQLTVFSRQLPAIFMSASPDCHAANNKVTIPLRSNMPDPPPAHNFDHFVFMGSIRASIRFPAFVIASFGVYGLWWVGS